MFIISTVCLAILCGFVIEKMLPRRFHKLAGAFLLAVGIVSYNFHVIDEGDIRDGFLLIIFVIGICLLFNRTKPVE